MDEAVDNPVDREEITVDEAPILWVGRCFDDLAGRVRKIGADSSGAFTVGVGASG